MTEEEAPRQVPQETVLELSLEELDRVAGSGVTGVQWPPPKEPVRPMSGPSPD
jgi:hypothetical protein